MRHRYIFICLLLLLFKHELYAQNGFNQGINFQAVARKYDGSILANKPITVRLSVREGSADGTIKYQEIKSVTTNIVGLFTIILGESELNRIVVIGPYNNIDWTTDNKYLQVEVDPTNSIVFNSLGTQKINYVPYAIFSNASNANNLKGIVPVEKGGTGVSNMIDLKKIIGIDKIDNTNDLNKPLSIKQQLALDKKMDVYDTNYMYQKQQLVLDKKMDVYDTNYMYQKQQLLLDKKMDYFDTIYMYNNIINKEIATNKSIDILTDSASSIKYPSVKAVKSYVDIATLGSISYPIPIIKGGSGAITSSSARSNLGLNIGTDILAFRTFGSAANSSISDFEPSITPGTSSQYLKGDKTWGLLNTSTISEGTNLYHTISRARSSISITNTGSNGAASYDSVTGHINIPVYSNDSINMIGDITGKGTNILTAQIGIGKVTNTMLAGEIDLSTKVLNTLPVSNGGTSSTSLGGILLGNGLNAVTTAAFGSFYDSTQQSAQAINTAYPMQLSNTDFVDGIVLENNIAGKPTRIKVNKTGKYNVQFSAQLNRTAGTTAEDVSIWIKKNETNVPATCTDISITGSATTSAPTVAAWNFFQKLNAGDYLEIMWSTTNTQIVIQYIGARTSPIRPAIPSLIVTIHQIN